MILAEWTGFRNVNVPALVICLTLVACCFVAGIIWLRKPETRTRGIWILGLVIAPAILAGLPLLGRLFSNLP